MSTYKAGSTHQMSVLLLADMAGAQFNPIPYKSGNETVVAMLGGNVDVVGTNPSNVFQHVEGGKARALLVTSAQRLKRLPDVPTAIELGMDTTQFHWRGIIAKRGIPTETLFEMNAAFARAVKSDIWQDYIKKVQLEDLFLGFEGINEYAENDMVDVKRLGKKMGFIK